MKYIYKYVAVLLCVVSFYSCGKSNDKGNTEEKEETKEQRVERQEKERLENNEILFIKAYDSIAYKSIDLVLKRVYKANSTSKPSISNTPLIEFKDSIKGTSTSDNITKAYIDSLINKKENYLKSNDLSTDKEFFKSTFKDILEWKLINNEIVYGLKKSDLNAEDLKDRKEKGDSLLLYIEKTINKAVSEFTPKKNENVTQTAAIVSTGTNNNSGENTTPTEDDETESKSMLLYGILGISVLLNIFLGWKLSKRNPEEIEISSNENNVSSNKNSGNSITTFEEKVKKEEKEEEKKPLSKQEIQKIVDTAHEKMLNNFNKYPKECLNNIGNLQSIKDDLVKIVLKNEYTDVINAEKSVSSQLAIYEDSTTKLLQNCNDKNLAIQKIKKAVDLEVENNFGFAKLHSVPKQEIHQKIELRKNNLIGELPSTLTTEELTQDIEKLIHNIKGDLSKLIEESLIYYLPFSDANGYFIDSKKSKTKTKDSIIKMYINPDNPLQATFHFMYEEKNRLKNAILSYDLLLLPICNLKEENFNSTGTVVTQIGDNGTLQLVDDLWKVEEKLNIKIT